MAFGINFSIFYVLLNLFTKFRSNQRPLEVILVLQQRDGYVWKRNYKFFALFIFNDDLRLFLERDFHSRINIQLTFVYWLAFYFISEKFDHFISPATELQVIECFDKYLESRIAAAARNQFYVFRTRTGVFEMAPAWREVNDFENFWRMMVRVK